MTSHRYKPRGVQIQQGHPLASYLGAAILINEGGGVTVADLLGRSSGIMSNSNGWGPTAVGTGIAFNGTNSIVKLNLDPCTDFADKDFTIAAWAMGNTIGTLAVASRGGTANAGSGGWALFPTAFNCKTSGGSGGYSRASSVTPLINTTFMLAVAGHMSTTVAGNCTSNFYNNGLLSNSTETQAAAYATASARTPALGARTDSGLPNGNAFFNGIVSMFLVWGRILSATEIFQLYSDPFCFMQPRRPSIGSSNSAITTSGLGPAGAFLW